MIYAQTDSLFAHFPAASKAEAVKLGLAAAAAVSAGFPPEMEIKYEKVCQPFMLLHVNRCDPRSHMSASSLMCNVCEHFRCHL